MRAQARPLSKFNRLHRKRERQGFTLVELLVALGILILLASLLLPAFARAREAAKRSSCMNNMRQIAMAANQYAQDYNWYYPPAPPSPSDGSLGWALTLANSLGTDHVFQCPSEPLPALDGFTDYWFNSELLGKNGVRITTPTSVVLIGEGSGSPVDYALGINATVDSLAWDPTREYCIRHGGGANYAFVDGHAKYIFPGKIAVATVPNGTNYTMLIN